MTHKHFAAHFALLFAALATVAPASALDMRFSPTPGNTPGSLKDDTLGINRADGKLFWKRPDGSPGVGALLDAQPSGRRVVEQGQADDLTVQGQTLGGWFSSAVFGTPTVSTLRAYPTLFIAPGSVILASGYYAAGDDGGGAFVWSSTSTATDDGGSVITPTGRTGAGRWLRLIGSTVSVKQFGARCIGSGDDLAAINAAHAAIPAAGGRLLFPSGTCNLSARFNLAVDQRKIAYLGTSREATNLRYIGPTQIDSLLYQGAPANGLNYNAPLEIAHLSLDGAGKVQWPLNLDYGQQSHVYDVLVTGAVPHSTYAGGSQIRLANYGTNTIGPNVRLGAGGMAQASWPSYSIITGSPDNWIMGTGARGAAVAAYLNTSGNNKFISNHPFATPVGYWATAQGSGTYIDNRVDSVSAIGYQIDSPNNYVSGGYMFSFGQPAGKANYGGLLSIPVTSAGAGYQSVPTIALTGSFGTTPTPQPVMRAQSCAVSGGTGYAVNDTVKLNAGTVSGLTGALPPEMTITAVSGGVPSACSVKIAGQMAAFTVSAGQASTTGSGSGATFSLTWGVDSVYVPHDGHGDLFSGTASASLSGGSPTTAATLGTPDYGNIGVALGPYARNSSVQGVNVTGVSDAAHVVALVNGTYLPAGTFVRNNPQGTLTGTMLESGFYYGGGDGGLSYDTPDGTNTGGNARGVGAVDLCHGRNNPANVASGAVSFCAGFNNRATAYASAVVGQHNLAQGAGSFVMGVRGSDQFMANGLTVGNNAFVTVGDNQFGFYAMSAVTSSTAPQRLFANNVTVGTAPSAGGALHQLPNSFASYDGTITCRDATNNSDRGSFDIKADILVGTSPANAVISGAPMITARSGNTATAPTITLAADTTYGGLAPSMTAPNNNTWRCSSVIRQVLN